jgi:hypothetical protein
MQTSKDNRARRSSVYQCPHPEPVGRAESHRRPCWDSPVFTSPGGLLATIEGRKG